jgi:hypothetical protein
MLTSRPVRYAIRECGMMRIAGDEHDLAAAEDRLPALST